MNLSLTLQLKIDPQTLRLVLTSLPLVLKLISVLAPFLMH